MPGNTATYLKIILITEIFTHKEKQQSGVPITHLPISIVASILKILVYFYIAFHLLPKYFEANPRHIIL